MHNVEEKDQSIEIDPEMSEARISRQGYKNNYIYM